MSIDQRVAAGAAFLDERLPNWWRADYPTPIDPSEIWIGSQRHCVLAYLAPEAAYPFYTMRVLRLRLGYRRSLSYGFQTPYAWPSVHRDIQPLNNAWRELIERRRAEVAGD